MHPNSNTPGQVKSLTDTASARHDTFHRIATAGSMLGLAMLVLALIFPAVFGSGAALAMAGTVATNVGEDTTPSDHLVRDVSDSLTYMDESAQVPFDQMLRRARRRKPADNIIVEWEKVDRTPPRLDTKNGAQTAGAAGASVDLAVNNAAMWRPNDLAKLMNQDTEPLLLVTAVDTSAGNITVYAMPEKTTKDRTADSFGTVPATTDTEPIARISPTKTQSDTPSDSRVMMPGREFNFIHTFDALVEASDHRQRTKNYTEDDWKRGKASNLIDLRRSMEYNNFFGVRSVTDDPSSNEPRWMQSGLVYYIDQTINYTKDSLTESEIVDWHTEIYTGNAGKKNRVLFADNNLAADIDKVMLSKMQHAPTRRIAGVEATELRTRHGRTYVVHHPGFDELGKDYWGVVVDLSQVFKVELQPLEKRAQDYKGTGGKDADAEQYIEKSTLTVGDASTHYIIEGT